MTRRVLELTPYKDVTRLAPADAPLASPIPRRVGATSPIKHVFYVIRENRTYDQVFGDMPRGNGDPSLTLFGEDITPNAHALAREFTQFDNFYVDAEVSYDGHAFSMGAYATDVVEKLWPTNYGSRGTPYLSEGGFNIRDQYGNFSAPPLGYIWDFAKRASVSGTQLWRIRRRGAAVAARCARRARAWRASSIQPIRPSISASRISSARTSGSRNSASSSVTAPCRSSRSSGSATITRAARRPVADSARDGGRQRSGARPHRRGDFHSRYWKDSAILVLEDDAQNGPDHVDAHRSVLLSISPFSRRRSLDSTLYTTSAVLRTIELILGLPPMSQYDAAATPMYAAFQPMTNTAPFTHLPARVSLEDKNDWSTPGARASLAMNLREADMAPELELNEILWRSIRGADAVMPPPRRTGFIRSIEDEDDARKRSGRGSTIANGNASRSAATTQPCASGRPGAPTAHSCSTRPRGSPRSARRNGGRRRSWSKAKRARCAISSSRRMRLRAADCRSRRLARRLCARGRATRLLHARATRTRWHSRRRRRRRRTWGRRGASTRGGSLGARQGLSYSDAQRVQWQPARESRLRTSRV